MGWVGQGRVRGEAEPAVKAEQQEHKPAQTTHPLTCPSQGQPLTKIEEDTDRDRYMSPLEAKVGLTVSGHILSLAHASLVRTHTRMLFCVLGS